MLAKDRSFRLRLTRRTRKWDSMKLSFERERGRERERQHCCTRRITVFKGEFYWDKREADRMDYSALELEGIEWGHFSRGGRGENKETFRTGNG